MNEPIIKWSGSKRYLASEIISYFPKKIETYYEPFVGGGSVFYNLMKNDNYGVKKYILSDINNDLIELWKTIQLKPYFIKKNYNLHWNNLNEIEDINNKKEYFCKVRKDFNSSRDPSLFMFLSRTSINGLIRYNSKNEFNSSLHLTRPGINPERFNKILDEWNFRIKENNVEFISQSYNKVNGDINDVIYLDPPYANTKGIYYGTIIYDDLFNWIKKQPSKVLLSFDGVTSEKNQLYNIPQDIFNTNSLCLKSKSSFNRLNKKNITVQESLYIKN